MKKILFAVFALAALASCTNNEVIELNREQIGFGEAFVDNATRADYSDGKTVEEFKVYGTVTGNTSTALIYNGNTVERPTSLAGYNNEVAWNCTETQYWVPNATYNFMAIVDGGESPVDAMPTTIDFTVDGNKDLLLATASVEVDNAGNKTALNTGALSTNGLVAFTFNHLLSKVYFTVTLPTMTGYSMEVTKIEVKGIKKNGKYTIADETWAATGDATVDPLDFLNKSYQILPVVQTLNVTISYNIKYGTTVISTATKAGKLENFAPKANNVYNVTAAIDALTGISFTVNTVTGWATPANTPLQ